MKTPRRLARICFLLPALAFLGACPFDSSLREYLSAYFWQPFAKREPSFEKPHVHRIYRPFAGMTPVDGHSSIANLRAAYQGVGDIDADKAMAAARADRSLSRRNKEEVDLIDAKWDIYDGESDEGQQHRESAKRKLQAFLKTARTPEYRSEARGWLARIYYLEGNQTAAGKIYLDELNRNGSNLSRETLLNSLRMNYGYDGGTELLDHLAEYFDTPEHAAFAIQLATNPHWHEDVNAGKTYSRIKELLEKHKDLLESDAGSNALALLTMRTALRMGDPPAARILSEAVPPDAPIRSDPDFNWMSASALFLTREFAAAEQPLLSLFHSPRASLDQKFAAAYGLCGVYWKTGNVTEQLRFALWLHTEDRTAQRYTDTANLADLSVYWASSGWDLGMLLEAEAPIDILARFVQENPDLPDIRLVKYSLAVRLTRENRYQEAADIYESIHAPRRASRIRKLAALYQETVRTDLTDPQRQQAKYNFAEFISANPDRIYFNDALWRGYQTYAFQASTDVRLTKAERETLLASERKVKDEQEERWRAYLILRDVAKDAPKTKLGRQAADLAIHCLLGISERFERQPEIRRHERELAVLLRR